MAETSAIHRLGQLSLTVTDLERSKAFYRDRVGLTLLFEVPNMGVLRLRRRPHHDDPAGGRNGRRELGSLLRRR